MSSDLASLEPIYTMTRANEPITLAAGEDIKIVGEGVECPGKADAVLEWLPSPRTVIRSTIEQSKADIGSISLGKNYRIHFPTRGGTIESCAVKVRTSSEESAPVAVDFRGQGCQTIQEPKGRKLREVRFHLLNFWNYFCKERSSRSAPQQLSLTADKWCLTIAPHVKIEGLETELKATRGYGITHVGKLERKDGKLFSTNQARDLLAALRYFVSFSRGFWAPPILPVGFDSKGKRVWEEWNVPLSDPWKTVWSWFPEFQGETLEKIFPGFWKVWSDAEWNAAKGESAIGRVLYWHLNSNTSAAGIDGGIILTQASLEVLAWIYAVKQRKLISREGFDKIKAADKLRLILSSMDIPLVVPSICSELKKIAKSRNWDGPDAFTVLRNATIHPEMKKESIAKKAKTAQAELTGVLYEGWNLGQWYVEMILLRLFGYSGDYNDRLRAKCHGEVSRVPWAT